MKSRLLQIVILLLGFGVLFTLGASGTPLLNKERPPIPLSVLPRETDSSVWAATRLGMEQAAADFGAELRILPPAVPNQALEQRSLLQRELEGGAAGILLTPADSTILAQAVSYAAAQAVVITLETDMSASGASSCIGVDNPLLGEALAVAALNGVPAGGQVLLVDSSSASTAISDRRDAAVQLLRRSGRRVTLCLPQAGQSLADALSLALSQGNFGAILAFETTATEIAARVAQSTEKPPLLYGTGATGTIVSYLEQSQLTAIATHNEFAAGYLAVQLAVELIRHQPLSSTEKLPFTLVRLEDMYELENQKLLFPVSK